MRPLVLVLATACWTQAPARPVEPPPPPPVAGYRPARSVQTFVQRCAAAIANAIEIGRAELERNGLPADAVDEIQDALVESCRTMEWSDETLACIGAIGGIADWNTCASQMTDDQRSDSTKRTVEVLQRRNVYGMGRGSAPP